MKHGDHRLIRRAAALAALALLCLGLDSCDYLGEQIAADLAFSGGTIDTRLVGVWQGPTALIRYSADGKAQEGANGSDGGFAGIGPIYEWRVKDSWLATRDQWGVTRCPVSFVSDGVADINGLRYSRR